MTHRRHSNFWKPNCIHNKSSATHLRHSNVLKQNCIPNKSFSELSGAIDVIKVFESRLNPERNRAANHRRHERFEENWIQNKSFSESSTSWKAKVPGNADGFDGTADRCGDDCYSTSVRKKTDATIDDDDGKCDEHDSDDELPLMVPRKQSDLPSPPW